MPSVDELFPPTPIRELEVWNIVRQMSKDSFLANYIVHAGASTDAHLGYHIAAGLALLTQSCPTSLALPIGTAKYANFFALILGASTNSRKTASVEIACDVLKRAIPGARGAEPGSWEMLRDGMVSQPRKLLVYEEFGAFLAATQQGYMQQMKTAFTSLFDCTPVSRETVKSKGQSTTCENPRLSLLCASTFEFLEEHTESVDWTGGFLARFFTFFGFREREYSPEPLINEAHRNAVAALLQRRAERTSYGVCAGLTPEAADAIRAFQQRVTVLMSSRDVPSPVVAAVSRSTSMLYRMALLLAWDMGDVHDTDPWFVSGLTMRLACAICDFHVRSCRMMGDSLTPDRDMRDRKRVLDAIGEDPTPLAYVLKKAQLLKPRFRIIMETLLAEGSIVLCGTGHGSHENVLLRRTTKHEAAQYRTAPPEAPPSGLPVFDPEGAQVISLHSASRLKPSAGGAVRENDAASDEAPRERLAAAASAAAATTPAASSDSEGPSSASSAASTSFDWGDVSSAFSSSESMADSTSAASADTLGEEVIFR